MKLYANYICGNTENKLLVGKKNGKGASKKNPKKMHKKVLLA
jgi:hypothetical protein